MASVTALHERPRGRVQVELDGVSWRLLPADAVVRCGLTVGRVLDRETARALARELRRGNALGVAVRALRHRDLSRAQLEERLARRGARADARVATVSTLERAGLVDDRRVALTRAASLAERGFGDAAIRYRLEQAALDAGAVAEALAALAPESERAAPLIERRGAGTKTARWLAGRGFDEATVAEALGGPRDTDLQERPAGR